MRRATSEVRQPAIFGQLIIAVVYLPILTLEGVEGKMFRPMAWTVHSGAGRLVIVSLTLMPVLASLLLGPAKASPAAIGPVPWADALYEAGFCGERWPTGGWVLGVAVGLLVAAGMVAAGWGRNSFRGFRKETS